MHASHTYNESMVNSRTGLQETYGNGVASVEGGGGARSVIPLMRSSSLSDTMMLSSEIGSLQPDFAAASFVPSRSPQSVASMNVSLSSLDFNVGHHRSHHRSHHDLAASASLDSSSAPEFHGPTRMRYGAPPLSVIRLRPRHTSRHQDFGSALSSTTGHIPVLEFGGMMIDPWGQEDSDERSIRHDVHGDLPCHILLPRIH